MRQRATLGSTVATFSIVLAQALVTGLRWNRRLLGWWNMYSSCVLCMLRNTSSRVGPVGNTRSKLLPIIRCVDGRRASSKQAPSRRQLVIKALWVHGCVTAGTGANVRSHGNQLLVSDATLWTRLFNATTQTTWRLATTAALPHSVSTGWPKTASLPIHYIDILPTALAWEVMQSPPSVRLSVRLFLLYVRNRLTVDLEFLHAGKPWP